MVYGSWDSEQNRQNFLSFWTIFCPFTSLITQKNQNFEKIKTMHGDIILHICTIRPHVVDVSFIVTCTHQKIKALFCCINFDYAVNFVKKCCFTFYFPSFEYQERKEKYTLNLIVLQNLL